MKNATITRKNATVHATYLPYPAYKRALELASAHKGKIGTTAEGLFKATFNSVEIAKKFVAEWTADYNANRKVEVAPTPTQKPKASKGKATDNKVVVTVDGKQFLVDASALVPAQTSKKSKPTATKGKTTSSTKKTTKAPRKTKGVAFDFGKIKGKTNTDKNRALHKELVKMGLKDSRTHEYMSVWNARPWAN
jgi:hypothetical protein